MNLLLVSRRQYNRVRRSFRVEGHTVPVGVKSVALQVENGVNHVLHYLRPRDRTRLRHVPHDEHGNAGALRQPDQSASALFHLRHPPPPDADKSGAKQDVKPLTTYQVPTNSWR